MSEDRVFFAFVASSLILAALSCIVIGMMVGCFAKHAAFSTEFDKESGSQYIWKRRQTLLWSLLWRAVLSAIGALAFVVIFMMTLPMLDFPWLGRGVISFACAGVLLLGGFLGAYRFLEKKENET